MIPTEPEQQIARDKRILILHIVVIIEGSVLLGMLWMAIFS